MSPERVEEYLEIWADYMRIGSGCRGYPQAVPGLLTGNLSSWEDLQDQVNKVSARAVDAAIADLEGIEQAAINHQFLAAVWRWNGQFERVYPQAVEKVGESLVRKGMV